MKALETGLSPKKVACWRNPACDKKPKREGEKNYENRIKYNQSSNGLGQIQKAMGNEWQ